MTTMRACRRATVALLCGLSWAAVGGVGMTIIALFRVINRYVGNLPPMTGVFPDYPASLTTRDR